MERTTLFSGLQMDRVGTLPGGGLARRDSGYLAAACSAPGTQVLLFHSTKPLAFGGVPPAMIRLPVEALVALCKAPSVDAMISAFNRAALIVLGVDAAGKAVIAADVTPLGKAEDVVAALAAIPAARAAISAQTGLPADAADAAATAGAPPLPLEFMEGRSLVFGASWSGSTVRPLAADAPLAGASASASTVAEPPAGAAPASRGAHSAAAAAATAAALPVSAEVAATMALQPPDLSWNLPYDDIGLFALARSLIVWHGKTLFCGACGSATTAIEGGVKKACSGGPSGTCKETNYPRTDPVVITLIQSKDGERLLLGRQPAFPPGYYSCLAGYMEGGESIEDAVRREVAEETAVRLKHVRYFASQPWPIGRGLFNQLMIGCLGTAENDTDSDIVIDKTELADARWFTREQVQRSLLFHYVPRPAKPAAAAPAASGTSTAADAPAASSATSVAAGGASATPTGRSASPSRAGGGDSKLLLPGPFAIAHQLVKAWVMREV